MSVYLDRKYLSLISCRLRNFKQKNEDLYNFSCPYCGDSQRNELRARGYVYRKDNDYFYMCHNCGVSTNFWRFLKNQDPEQHHEYVMERWLDSRPSSKRENTQKLQEKIDDITPREHFKTFGDVVIPNISELPKEHYARMYIEGRKIPPEFWNEIFYAEDFKEFLDDFHPKHGKDLMSNDPRIILFSTSMDGYITNVSGRALKSGDKALRYIAIKVTNDKKIFGLHRSRSNQENLCH